MAAHPLAPVRGSDRLVVATSQTCATKPRRPPPCRSRPRASAAPLSVVRPFALASNESSDTFVLPFASQINHAPSTPAHNRPFEAEVIFCVQGAMPAPWRVPSTVSAYTPPSRMPARSHWPIRRRTLGSAILCASIRSSQSWSEYPVHWLRRDGFAHHPQRLMSTASGSEAKGAIEEVGFIDGAQNL